MVRPLDAEAERLRSEISLVRLVETSGVSLQKHGGEQIGQCPFHEDGASSLIVSTADNRWRCSGACDVGGDVIDWVMKRHGVSFHHAVELLRDGAVEATAPVAVAKLSTVRRLPSPVDHAADDQALLNQVVGYYHETLKQNPEGLAFLQARGLKNDDLIERFRLGCANRTLGLRLPDKTRKAGAEIRSRLERIGLYRTSGHEHFNGSLIVPILDEGGNIVEVYGRKLRDNLRAGTPLELYLPGPRRGVWNVGAMASCRGEMILTASLIDAMTFWCAGYRNVTAAHGEDGLTHDHLIAFEQHDVERVLIAFGRDDEGDHAATSAAERLIAAGLACYRIEFPKGMDANLYAQKVTPSAKSLGVLIRKAAWLGNGKAPPPTSAPIDELEVLLGRPLDAVPAEPPPILTPAPEPLFIPELATASPLPDLPADDPVLAQTEHELVLALGDRRYRVRGWKKPLNPESLKINLLVHRGERFHVDTFDLYSAKARAGFVKQAGLELGEAEEVLKHDLGRVLLKLEALQEAEITAALTKDERPVMTDAERAEALDLLRSPDLMDRILADFATCGVVGEGANLLVAYLACVSRLLDRPLAVIIQSSSAAGKSSLMDAVLALMPTEAQVRYSAMTGQSLFYMGETNLKHRILAIAEEEGAESASYALKLLQSDGEVTIASTGKDATTGLLVTHEYRVEGPVMLFLTTTAIDIDEELMNRCLVLTVNESREQTRAIHALQRSRQTLAGLLAEDDRHAVLKLHRNAQSLLERLKVVNPFADRLTFLDDKTRTRRDHMKYLTLIRAIALVGQHRREVHTVEHRGKVVRYVEVEPQDIHLANRLAYEVLGRTLDELPPQTRRLLSSLNAWVDAECERLAVRRPDFRFSRRQVRAVTGWGDTQLKVHLARLAALEYVLVHRVRSGQGYEYELLYEGEGETGDPFVMGLAEPPLSDPPGAHAYDDQRSGSEPSRSPHGRGVVGGQSGAGRPAELAETPSRAGTSEDGATVVADLRVTPSEDAPPSYPQAPANVAG
jgi:DNA primase